VQSDADSGAPQDVLWMLDYLFATVLDGRNAYLTAGLYLIAAVTLITSGQVQS